MRVLAADDLHVATGELAVRVRFSTAGIDRSALGLPISDEYEDVTFRFDGRYPDAPPTLFVEHTRFVGYPHVLAGCILCIYLDEDREWHPALGMTGVVKRLMAWLEDAAQDRFDSRAALYHPIGGLPPSPRTAGTLVVRESRPERQSKLTSRATIARRNDTRLDLVAWSDPRGLAAADCFSALVLRTTVPMPLGLVDVDNLAKLAFRIERARGPKPAMVAAALEGVLSKLPKGAPLLLLVDVAHPADDQLSYLAVARVRPDAVDAMRSAEATNWPFEHVPIGWMRVSDERSEIATRRDSQRPMAAFEGKSVELWGCGGLGSWIAEFICRAGAARMVLRDNGGVDGGLLVRQNYVEDDIGRSKAVQLADRLRSISDRMEVEPLPGSALGVLADGFVPTTNVLIDATINVTVAARLDGWARTAESRPLMAQVATDPRSATLGLLVVATPQLGFGPATVDDATWEIIRTDATLERFHAFWTEAQRDEQIVPALGCSTPTFHGSAADLASLAGSLASLLAPHLETPVDGAHLIEASHARGPEFGAHHFVRCRAPHSD